MKRYTIRGFKYEEESPMARLQELEDKIEDGVLVEVKHGDWHMRGLDEFRKYKVTCSCCSASYVGNYDAYVEPEDFYYCPNCGAKMDGERKD